MLLKTALFSLFFAMVLFAETSVNQASDLIFNITHTKLKTKVYKTIVTFFEKKGRQYDCKSKSFKDFQKGRVSVFSSYKCNGSSQSYACDIVISDINAKLNFKSATKENKDHECLNKMYIRWLELKDALALRISSLEDTPSSAVPPEVALGAGFKNIPFGISSDSVYAILDMSGYIEGGRQVSIHPKFHENYFFRDTTSGKKNYILIAKLGEYISKVMLDFTADNMFYSFTITLPPKTDKFYKNVRDKDCKFLTSIFSKKYGKPDTTFKSVPQNKSSSANVVVGLWSKKEYEAYTAIAAVSQKYYAVGTVKSRPLMEKQKMLREKETQKKLKKASEQF